jgi:mRNA interferase MazF
MNVRPIGRIQPLRFAATRRKFWLDMTDAVFTAATGLAIVCPITSRVRPFPTSVVLPQGLPVAGEILVSHVRSIDTLAHPVRSAGAAVPAAIAALVRAKLAALITI